jgi:methylmalonyl-CoA mutase, N-terminal domain
MVQAVEKGLPQAEIQEAAYRYQREIESGRRRIVGVNAYESGKAGKAHPMLKVSPALEAKQKKTLKAFRDRRSMPPVKKALGTLEAAARGTTNTFPAILAAVEAGATLGEVCGTLRSVFGEAAAAR